MSRLRRPAGAEPAPLPLGLRLGGLFIYGVLGVLTALYEVMFVPIRMGTVLVPVAVVLAVGTNIVLPYLSHRLTGSVAGALPPVIAWIVSVGALSSTRPEGDVLLPGGGGVQFVSYGVLLGGLLAGLLTVALIAGSASSGERSRARRAALEQERLHSRIQ
jgi:hypothetical protein